MITSLYAALLTLIYIGLSIYVIAGRWKFKLAVGDGNQDNMKRRIRAHGNFAEYAPLFLIILGLAEYSGLPASAVHGFGLLFVAARLLHAYSLTIGERYKDGILTGGIRFRSIGMVGTFTSMALLALVLIVQWIANSH
ncbi:MAG: MAPEG family protein [Alphaproteobacteria bacterium]|nr:MAPEG family protein [Alphaproteobacteria bacterium]